MNNLYTCEKNYQILISLLKKFNIRTVIASPGTTNIAFVASVQGDSFFKVYSAPDERVAAYMACGYAAEKGEPVILTCTGATASRNYVPGLTEAYYRKLPVIAITSAKHMGYIGQLTPQVIDRTSIQNDIAVYSAQIPTINSNDDEWYSIVKLNEAILCAIEKRGPVHINIVSEMRTDFDVKKLPEVRQIHRYYNNDELPEIVYPQVAIFVGNHIPFTKHEEMEIELFCEKYNACVICDHTSNYHGKYAIQYNLISDQKDYGGELKRVELLIDLGEISGAYMKIKPEVVWRVNREGLIQDRFKILTKIFAMEEYEFFSLYNQKKEKVGKDLSYYFKLKHMYENALQQIDDVPFSNIWIAKQMRAKMPDGCIIHFGILNSLRSWNYFELPSTINCYCNTGGFGIDGALSTLVGASLANPSILHYGIVGDLAFFYDMNSLGNRHIGENIRILLINNGIGTEFKNYSHIAAKFEEDANDYIAAAGHYGNKSTDLVRHYAEDMGFKYISANDKRSFMNQMDVFTNPPNDDKCSMIFEVFTNDKDESEALKYVNHIVKDDMHMKNIAKNMVKDVIGEKGIKVIKQLVK